MSNKYKYLRYGDRLLLMNGVDELRYVDLTTGELVKYRQKLTVGGIFRRLVCRKSRPGIEYTYKYISRKR